MDTTIGYLEQVRSDLLNAGFREVRRRRRPMRGRISSRALVAAAAAVVIVAAGGIGWLVTNGGILEQGSGSGGGNAALEPAGPMPSAVPGEHRLSLFESLPTWYANVQVQNESASADAIVVAGASRVIRTAEIGLVIPPDSFGERFADAVSVASDHGGYVQNSTTRDRSGNLIVRVPADEFNATLQDLREIGNVEVQSIRGQDVTADYIDLRARLRIARARLEVLLGLMGDARTIEQTIRVRNALDDTQLQIEQLQGQLRLLDDRTSLASIQIGLREEGVEPAAEVDTPSIPNAFERSVAGFVGVIAGVVVGLGYLIPVVALSLAVWFVVLRVRRRRAEA